MNLRVEFKKVGGGIAHLTNSSLAYVVPAFREFYLCLSIKIDDVCRFCFCTEFCLTGYKEATVQYHNCE